MKTVPVTWRGRVGRATLDTLVGVAIATGALLSVVLFVTTAYFVILCVIGIGFLALPYLTRAVRRLCDLNRRAAARYGVPVERPYRPEPEVIEKDIVGWMRRCKWILADPATWRDLLWLLLNCVVGLVGFVPAALLYYAGEGLFPACGLWRPLADDGHGRWYAFVTVGSWPAALAAALLALVLLTGWLFLGAPVLKGVRLLRPLPARPHPPVPTRLPGPALVRDPVRCPSTSRPPSCAASNGTCTTAHRRGWSAWGSNSVRWTAR
ncbi:sensor domain-containing protein [Streptomyces tricolor]|nr:sensor domain-containing protein [Streptomyces tricolor]